VRLPALVVRIREVAENGARVDARVDAQQRQPNSIEVAIGQCPEASMGVAVLGRDARMHDERAEPRNREQVLVQQDAGPRQHQVGPGFRYEAQSLAAIGAVRNQSGELRRERGKAAAQLCARIFLPAAIVALESESVIGSKGKDVEEAQQTAASNLSAYALEPPRLRLPNGDDSYEGREGPQPGSQDLSVEVGVVVIDEDGPQEELTPP
jgi:hypothetical protein